MAQMSVARREGMTLVYDTDDVARMDISTPHDVVEDAAGRKQLGDAHLNVSIDFLPGRRPRWAGLPPEIAELGIEEVRVLRLEPDDAIVLMAPKRLSVDEQVSMVEQLGRMFASHRIVVLDAGLSLEVLRGGGEPQ